VEDLARSPNEGDQVGEEEDLQASSSVIGSLSKGRGLV
jgi:hypothetical protein